MKYLLKVLLLNEGKWDVMGDGVFVLEQKVVSSGSACARALIPNCACSGNQMTKNTSAVYKTSPTLLDHSWICLR